MAKSVMTSLSGMLVKTSCDYHEDALKPAEDLDTRGNVMNAGELDEMHTFLDYDDDELPV